MSLIDLKCMLAYLYFRQEFAMIVCRLQELAPKSDEIEAAVVVQIDNKIMQLSDPFKYLPNPVISSVTPTRAFFR